MRHHKKKDETSRKKFSRKNKLVYWYSTQPVRYNFKNLPKYFFCCSLRTYLANGALVVSIQLKTKACFGVRVWLSHILYLSRFVKEKFKTSLSCQKNHLVYDRIKNKIQRLVYCH